MTRFFHRHYGEIIISKRELMHQLSCASKHDNLLHLLTYGKDMPDYDTRLTRAALKFEFLGSMLYATGRGRTEKPCLRRYIELLFQNFYENADDFRIALAHCIPKPVSDERVQRVFCKLLFVMGHCCPLMAETYEIRSEAVYRLLIEYAVEHECTEYVAVQSIWESVPSDIPENGSILAYLCSRLPVDLASALSKAELLENPIRW